MITFIRTNPLLAQRLAKLKAKALLAGRKITYADLLVEEMSKIPEDKETKDGYNTLTQQQA